MEDKMKLHISTCKVLEFEPNNKDTNLATEEMIIFLLALLSKVENGIMKYLSAGEMIAWNKREILVRTEANQKGETLMLCSD